MKSHRRRTPEALHRRGAPVLLHLFNGAASFCAERFEAALGFGRRG